MAEPDKSAQLRAVPIFATLHEDALWSLAESASDFDAAAGQVLIQPNQPGNGLLILTAGRASVELGTQTIVTTRVKAIEMAAVEVAPDESVH